MAEMRGRSAQSAGTVACFMWEGSRKPEGYLVEKWTKSRILARGQSWRKAVWATATSWKVEYPTPFGKMSLQVARSEFSATASNMPLKVMRDASVEIGSITGILASRRSLSISSFVAAECSSAATYAAHVFFFVFFLPFVASLKALTTSKRVMLGLSRFHFSGSCSFRRCTPRAQATSSVSAASTRVLTSSFGRLKRYSKKKP
mmetsp:Transcript_882/g.2485  ORF Transcript_882/g.2485 Transcript_882/m.2485 type:complete len:203 (-) Transcript_882:479-1087(-)